jgi:phenylpropionate dioxygenase-like ring-hydroxylating dioxygenase large terminal subunit
VRILGEDLILFRDGKERPGLVHSRCAHRGTTLFYGKVEENGIRCCYHGWLFGVDGKCNDQPCEPNGGLHRDRVIQPWYEVEERYGLIWAYLGPPDRKPILPRYDILERLDEDQYVYATGSAFGAGGDDTREIIPCNWLQDWENIMDPFHVPILHATFSGVQFVPDFAIMPQVTFERADHGMMYTATRDLPDGRHLERVTQALFPHVRIVPDVRLAEGKGSSVGFVVPVDDTNFRLFHVMKMPKGTTFTEIRILGKKWSEMTPEEHQTNPGDWEAQVGQGAITFHSEEHLTSSDTGVGRLRAFMREQIKLVQSGGDPIGVTFDPAEETYHVRTGNDFSRQQATPIAHGFTSPASS